MLKEIKVLKYVVVVVMLFATTELFAQFNGGNIASPYSIYGIGDLRTTGTAISRSMGSGGYAMRDPSSFNMLNPASYSIAPRQTFLFSGGLEGVNSYLSTNNATTSQNAANLGYVSVRFPVANGLGFGFSMSPYSSVGYSIRKTDQRDDVVENIGGINYEYTGKGDIAQYKMGFGWQAFKGFSLGANFIYYHGALNHNVEVVTNSYVSNVAYATIFKDKTIRVNNMGFELGLQYHLQFSENAGIIFAGVYQPKIDGNVDIDFLTTSQNSVKLDTLYNNTISNSFSIPQKIAVGVSYVSNKMKISLDYTNEDFKNSFYNQMLDENVEYKAKNTFILGFEYVPDVYDIRKYQSRMSYRFGLRYSDSYYDYKGNRMDEFAISAGIGFPFNYAIFSSVNAGVEYALRGTKQNEMIQTQFLNFFVDFNLFAHTQWFVRFKNH